MRDLIFANQKLPIATEKKIAYDLIKSGDYGEVNPNKLKEVSKKYGVKKDICLCIRTQYMRQKIISKGYWNVKHKGTIEDPKKILLLAVKYDKPPVGLYRHLGGKNKQIEAILRPYDHFIGIEPKDVIIASRNFEIALEDALSAHGVKFETQETLVPKQIKEFGRAVATPDVLFKAPMLIESNGRKIEIIWVDCKNYYASYVPHIVKSLKEQGDKYKKHFGNGVFLFRYGCSELYFDTPEYIYRG